jgi:hypothetical protein
LSNNFTNIIALLKFFSILMLIIMAVVAIRRLLDSLDSAPRKRRRPTKHKSNSEAPKSNEWNKRQSAIVKPPKTTGYINKSARKGEWGEEKDRMELSHLSSEYKVLHDILIPYKNWNLDYSQIDHVVTSIYGIFVVEAKNYSGVIFGDENGEWYQNDRPIKNPIKQNERHIHAIKELLLKNGYKDLLFYNIVTLNSRCNMTQVTAYTVVPDIHLQNLIEKRSKQKVLTMEQVERIHYILGKSNIRDKAIRKLHIEQINAITSNDSPKCVLCDKKVTIGIRNFCLGNPERFHGNIYCMEHQNHPITVRGLK